MFTVDSAKPAASAASVDAHWALRRAQFDTSTRFVALVRYSRNIDG